MDACVGGNGGADVDPDGGRILSLIHISMPLAAKIVKIGHYQLLDGGVADSIPVHFFESIGYKRNLIVLTQPKDFVKKKNKMLPAIRARYLRYPAFVDVYKRQQ